MILSVIASAVPATEPVPAWLVPTVLLGTLFQFFFVPAVTWVIFKLAKTDRNYEAIEQRLIKANETVIDERFRRVSHSVANHAQQFTSALDAMSLHVKERDIAFAKLLEVNPHQELRMERAINALSKEVRDSTCSTEDFDELKKSHGETRQQLENLRDQVARIPVLSDFRTLLEEFRK